MASVQELKSVDVSVVICTHNRADLLEMLLSSAKSLRVARDLSWEFLIIDNNSRDDTRAILARHEGALPLRYELEEQVGKTCALNRALGSSKGKLLLFADDDVVLPTNWLAAFVERAQLSPEFGWFGGRVKPDWNGSPPAWFREETAPALSGYFGDYDLGDRSRPYTELDKLPLGASLAIRRTVFDKVGGFRIDLGPRGRLRGVGEETEFLQRAVAAGFPGYYLADAPVLHYVGRERRKLAGFLNYGIGKGSNQYRLGTEGKRSGSLIRAAEQLLRSVPQALRGRGDRFRICLINAGIEIGRRAAAREARN
jgi:GT2 family glycosyltransferase